MMNPTDIVPGFSSRKEVEEYCSFSLQRYHWYDLISAIVDGYLVYHILYRVDVTGEATSMVGPFALVFRVYFTFKIFLHIFVLPFLAFGGSINKLSMLIASRKTYDMVAPTKVSNMNSNKDNFLMALYSRAVLLDNQRTKANFFFKILGIICLTAFILVLEHNIYRLLDIALMSVWICVGSFATYVHFIYFPTNFTPGDKDQSKEVILPPRIGYLVLLYTTIMIGGWTFGNYLSVLDWDEPFVFFPNGNYIGICLGHLVAALFGTIGIIIGA